MDIACEDEPDMKNCLENCMNEKSSSHDEEWTNKKPPCPEMTSYICECGNECTATDGCKVPMREALNCVLIHELNCKGNSCSKAVFGLGERVLDEEYATPSNSNDEL